VTMKLMEIYICTGDAVGTDDIVLQIETDKVTVDVRYTTGKPGKLKEMLVKEEDTVAVGQEVAIVTEGEEGAAPEADKVSKLTYSVDVLELATAAIVLCKSRAVDGLRSTW